MTGYKTIIFELDTALNSIPLYSAFFVLYYILHHQFFFSYTVMVIKKNNDKILGKRKLNLQKSRIL